VASNAEDPKKRGRKVRVELRRNRGKTVRDKSGWTQGFHDDDIEQADATQVESVRAKGDLSRKRTIIVGGESEEAKHWGHGVVVAMHGRVAEVDDGDGRWACTARRTLRTRLSRQRHAIVVGDRVRFSRVEVAGERSRPASKPRQLPEGVIEEVAKRTTTLTRHYGRREHVMAANVDTAVICVATRRPTLRPHLIDRYLVAVHRGSMRPVVCVNKADLDADGAAAEIIQRYARIGYTALLTSAVEDRGIEALRDAINENMSVFVGPSGVGKSSLLNALNPGFSLRIGDLSDLDRGRHTTTTACLLKWDFGGYVVDTPGIRQFELTRIPPEELEAYFKEFVPLIPECRFADCSHTHETGCAIRSAVEDGRIDPARHESYCRMYAECIEKDHEYD